MSATDLHRALATPRTSLSLSDDPYGCAELGVCRTVSEFRNVALHASTIEWEGQRRRARRALERPGRRSPGRGGGAWGAVSNEQQSQRLVPFHSDTLILKTRPTELRVAPSALPRASCGHGR